MFTKSVSAFVVTFALVLAASPAFAKPSRGHGHGHHKKRVVVVEHHTVVAPAPRVVVRAPAPRVVVRAPSVTVH